MQALDYDKMASTYARHRIANKSVLDELRRKWVSSSESRVLEVGCGTGLHLRALVEATCCKGWGIDLSRKMLHYAVDSDDIHFIEGSVEELHFETGFLDLVFSVNVVHHVTNMRDYFLEALRVLKTDGLICTATDSEKMIRSRKPLAQYWPGTIDAELRRYSSIELLRQQMTDAGFVDLEEHATHWTFEVSDTKPYREKAFSCLHLISDEEFMEGLRHLETDLKAGPVIGLSEHICLWGRRK